MRGCKIIFNGNEIHTGNDLDLVQEKKEIKSPEVQSYEVKVPGRNGVLNLSKALTGRIAYYNREINLQYFAYDPNRSRLLEIADQFNRYHGETIRIVDDDTPNHYYEGECTVSTALTKNYLQIAIAISAYPFRRALQSTVKTVTLSSTVKTVQVVNNGVTVAPIFTTTGTVKIVKGDISKTVNNATSWEDLELLIDPGTNSFKVSGSGSLTIEFREAKI